MGSYEYVNFGFPNTTLLPLTGLNLNEDCPVDGVLVAIVIDSPSEFMGIRCLVNQIQILPLEGEITIRTAVRYPINKNVNMKDRLVVALDNHDPLITHTPSIVWEIEETKEISGEIE